MEGENYIGKKNEENPPHVVLNGVGIDKKHCTLDFSTENKTCHLIPNEDSAKYTVRVNGDIVDEKVELNHGDRILVGSHHYYLFVDPTIDNNAEFDYDDAMQEAHKEQMENSKREKQEEEERKHKEMDDKIRIQKEEADRKVRE